MPLRPVYVVGVGMAKFVRPDSTNEGFKQHVKKAVTEALLDAGIDYLEVEQACVGYVHGESGRGQRLLYDFGMTGIPIHNVNNNCATGATALYLAKQLVEAGSCECCLAVGFEVMDKGPLVSKFRDRTHPMDKHIELLSDTYGIVPAPVTAQFFGAAAREHMSKYNSTVEHFAKIAWKNHKHSLNNPYSLQQGEYTLEDILQAKEVYHPLTKLQCCPVSNGSAAVILASEQFVLKHGLQDRAVEILAMELATDLPTTFSERSSIKLVGFDMTRRAAEAAFKHAGISPKDINVVELHDCFSANELITYEALGLCDIGKGPELVDSGDNTYGGKYVINPSGGLIGKGHPLGATGIAQCAELIWQLRHKADKRQVPNAKLALQHNIGLGGAAVVAIYKKGFDGIGQDSFKSDSFFKNLAEILLKSAQIKNIIGSISFKVINGPNNGIRFWTAKLDNGTCLIESGQCHSPNCIVIADDNVFAEVGNNFENLLRNKSVKIDGDSEFILKLFPRKHRFGKL